MFVQKKENVEKTTTLITQQIEGAHTNPTHTHTGQKLLQTRFIHLQSNRVMNNIGCKVKRMVRGRATEEKIK